MNSAPFRPGILKSVRTRSGVLLAVHSSAAKDWRNRGSLHPGQGSRKPRQQGAVGHSIVDDQNEWHCKPRRLLSKPLSRRTLPLHV